MKSTRTNMDLFHKIQGIVDKNMWNFPEGDYLEICNTVKELRDLVTPPTFLLDQNQPLILPQYESTDQEFSDFLEHTEVGFWADRDHPLLFPEYEPTLPQPSHWRNHIEQLREPTNRALEEPSKQELEEFLQELHAEWSTTETDQRSRFSFRVE